MRKFLFFAFFSFMLCSCSADGIPGVVTITAPVPTPGPRTATPFLVLTPLILVPGMGRFFVLSMTGRDYPMIMAVVLLYGVFLTLMNLAVDLLYGFIDPRIRY